jgi:hypothetical protein
MGTIWAKLLASLSPRQICYVCVLIACGGGLYAIRTFAQDSDVDLKITAAQKPLIEAQQTTDAKVDRLSETVDRLSTLVTEQLAATVAAQIRLNISKRCKTQGWVEREELAREKDRLQGQYRGYKGFFYAEPTCAEL